jgi:hypothetical protein
MCLRVGKLSITERIGGLLRTDLAHLFDVVLQRGNAANQLGEAPSLDDPFFTPILAWFKPHSSLPLHLLYRSTPLPAGTMIPPLHLTLAQQSTLVSQFFHAVYPLCPLVSRSDLLPYLSSRGAASIYDPISMQSEVNNTPMQVPVCPVTLAVFYAASTTLPFLTVQRLFPATTKEALTRKLRRAAEVALAAATPAHRLDLQLFQSLLIYLTPQMISEVSRPHAVYMGSLVRHFQIAGHDRDDPPPRSLGQEMMLEDEDDESRLQRRQQWRQWAQRQRLKRHLWQHLLFLSSRATEAVGPERSIVHDDDAGMPDQVLGDSAGDEEDSPIDSHSDHMLGDEYDADSNYSGSNGQGHGSTVSEPYDGRRWEKEAQVVSVVRYHCYALHRMVFRERERLRRGEVSIYALLDDIARRSAEIRFRYMSQLDESIPVHKYARIVGHLLLARAENMVLGSQFHKWMEPFKVHDLRDR